MRSLEELIAAARENRGGALALRGEAGIGKSALLEYAESAAAGFQVIHASGSEFESELPFAALHQLCRPLCVPSLGYLAGLPAPHRDALEVAFGLASGPPDFFRVGLAALELLAAAARERPLLCVIDDAQWLDVASSKALTFLTRRITAEPIAMVLAIRVPCAARELDGLPGLDIGRLSDSDARVLLAGKSPVMVDEQVCDRLMAEARGNPLALLQLPRVDGFTLPDTSSVLTRIERNFQARLAGLPADARRLLTIASADPTGDPGLLWPAAQRLAIDVTTTSAAVTATGLVEFSTRVRFCHPLARSAVYLAADDEQRREAHRVLAEVTDSGVDPDRQIWHRAQAGTGPDEDVATELERSASRALSRGGVVAAAAFIKRSAELSLVPGKRVERTLAAVQAQLDAGAPEVAADLLGMVENSGTDERQHAHVDVLRGQIAFQRHRDDTGPAFLVRAGQRLAALDPARSRDCFLDALGMSLLVGRATEVMGMVLAAAESSAPPSPSPDLLDALILLSKGEHRAAVPLIRDALDDIDGPTWAGRPLLAVILAAELWDPHVQPAVITWLMKTARASGSPMVLSFGLGLTATSAVLAGDLGQAMAAIAEEEAIADAVGGFSAPYPRMHLAAMRGRREEALELFELARATDGTGQVSLNVQWSAAVLYNSLGDYPAALAAARQATEQGGLGFAGLVLPELVEAAVRCGEHEDAATALEALTERTDASGTAMGLGIAAYARGLVTGVEDHYREAIDYLEESSLLPYRARAHLLYGEWLRREGRRKDCRVHLRTAHDLLSGAGFEAFARRAAIELATAGETARGRTGHPYDQLTMQEVHIARLVATGATSNEVAARLFISPRTVDAHLRNIFRKLGITSRRQLRDQPDLHTGQAP